MPLCGLASLRGLAMSVHVRSNQRSNARFHAWWDLNPQPHAAMKRTKREQTNAG